MKEAEENLEKLEDEPADAAEKKDIFSVEEIKIEEMAIDGICGVY